MKARASQCLCGMSYAFYFYEISTGSLNAFLTYRMTRIVQEVDNMVLWSSHTSLVITLGWPGRETRTKNLEWGAHDSRRLLQQRHRAPSPIIRYRGSIRSVVIYYFSKNSCQ